jgi:hypothetical protein
MKKKLTSGEKIIIFLTAISLLLIILSFLLTPLYNQWYENKDGLKVYVDSEGVGFKFFNGEDNKPPHIEIDYALVFENTTNKQELFESAECLGIIAPNSWKYDYQKDNKAEYPQSFIDSHDLVGEADGYMGIKAHLIMRFPIRSYVWTENQN